MSHETIVNGFLVDPLEFEPGSDFAPSNSNAAMLGLVIERAAGVPYEEVVRTRVLEPLELQHTTWGEADDNAVGLVFNEKEHLDVPPKVDPRAFGGAGGWSSTTADLHRFYAGVLAGRFGGERSRLRWLGDNSYARPYGLIELSIDGKPAYVWLGRIDGFNSAALIVPDDELVVTVLANSEVLPAEQLATDVAQLAYGQRIPEREEPRAVPVDPSTLAALAGNWTITRGTETMLLDAVSPETFDKLRRVQTHWGRRRVGALPADPRPRFQAYARPGQRPLLLQGRTAVDRELHREPGRPRPRARRHRTPLRQDPIKRLNTASLARPGSSGKQGTGRRRRRRRGSWRAGGGRGRRARPRRRRARRGSPGAGSCG